MSIADISLDWVKKNRHFKVGVLETTALTLLCELNPENFDYHSYEMKGDTSLLTRKEYTAEIYWYPDKDEFFKKGESGFYKPLSTEIPIIFSIQFPWNKDSYNWDRPEEKIFYHNAGTSQIKIESKLLPKDFKEAYISELKKMS
jgi:hypothetical protein